MGSVTETIPGDILSAGFPGAKPLAQSDTDLLTGLPNKSRTEAEITRMLEQHPEQLHALLLIDMDNFKALNDRDGQLAGDQAIRAVTNLLLGSFRKNDIIGRIGGDEFAVLMTGVPGSDVVRKKVDILTTAIRYESGGPSSAELTLSIGFAMSGVETGGYTELFQRADEALYRAKCEGRGQAHEGVVSHAPVESASRRRTVMAVDDSSINRSILRKNLCDEYEVLEAENGVEALKMLRRHGADIEVIILDLVMPEMDGFAFLMELQNYQAWRDIPVLVATGSNDAEQESRALRLGAWDFVSKPYNMEVLKFRLRNAILRSQMSAFNQLKYLAEYDTLTGIYNKRKFFEMTRDMLLAHPQERFLFVRMDFEKFKLINSYFGTAVGDRVLQGVAQAFRKYSAAHPVITYGYIQADVFCACVPFVSKERVIEKLAESRAAIAGMFKDLQLSPVYGLYIVSDPEIGVDRMYDNAIVASSCCKGNYMLNYAFYEESMRSQLERENEMTNQMSAALENDQFTVYYQPEYSAKTEKPVGAEALVRWKKPDGSLVPPSDFIPLFEKNGFISRLDSYVWERVCAMLRKRLDEGKRVSPISVNASRVDLYESDLVGRMTQLVKAYSIPPKLLNIEITESAYAVNPLLIQRIVGELQSAGFAVMMDDFGSAYSSLNMLKDLPVDVLKIDMRFLSAENSPRAELILRSVVGMAKQLEMTVIVEGVETLPQAEYLREIGCDFIQGYYYSKPMPQQDYEKLMDGSEETAK